MVIYMKATESYIPMVLFVNMLYRITIPQTDESCSVLSCGTVDVFDLIYV